MAYNLLDWRAPVAQLDRALVSGTKGRGFESLRAYQLFVSDMSLIAPKGCLRGSSNVLPFNFRFEKTKSSKYRFLSTDTVSLSNISTAREAISRMKLAHHNILGYNLTSFLLWQKYAKKD